MPKGLHNTYSVIVAWLPKWQSPRFTWEMSRWGLHSTASALIVVSFFFATIPIAAHTAEPLTTGAFAVKLFAALGLAGCLVAMGLLIVVACVNGTER